MNIAFKVSYNFPKIQLNIDGIVISIIFIIHSFVDIYSNISISDSDIIYNSDYCLINVSKN